MLEKHSSINTCPTHLATVALKAEISSLGRGLCLAWTVKGTHSHKITCSEFITAGVLTRLRKAEGYIFLIACLDVCAFL